MSWSTGTATWSLMWSLQAFASIVVLQTIPYARSFRHLRLERVEGCWLYDKSSRAETWLNKYVRGAHGFYPWEMAFHGEAPAADANLFVVAQPQTTTSFLEIDLNRVA